MPQSLSRYSRPNTVGRYGSYRNYATIAKFAAKAARSAYNSYTSKPKTTYKKTRSRARSKPKRAKKSLRCCVRKLQKQVAKDTGTHIHRLRQTGRSLAVVNQVVHTTVVANTAALMEIAGTDMKYFDSSLPGTLDDVDIAEGTFSHKVLFDTIYSSLTVTNNYGAPCWCTVYICMPKKDTNKSVGLAYTDGLADVGSPPVDSQLVYVTDSPVFRNLWKIVKTTRKKLQPGSGYTTSHTSKNVTYDPSLNDTHSDTFQSKDKALVYLIRVEGVLSHDSTSDQQGRGKAGVDYEMNRKYIIKYAAGAQLTTIVETDTSDALPLGRVSQKPQAGQQNYTTA